MGGGEGRTQPLTAPRTEPQIQPVTDDIDAPDGFLFYFDLNEHCRRWARTYAQAIEMLDRLQELQRRRESGIPDNAPPACGLRSGDRAALSAQCAIEIVRLYQAGERPIDIARRFNVPKRTVFRIMDGSAYYNVTGIEKKR